MSGEEADGWYYYASDGTEALRVIEESLLALEANQDAAGTVHGLYRALHTLKGNSAVMGLPAIEHLAHAAEDMVGLVRDRGVPVDRDFIDVMLKVVDMLSFTVDRAGREHRDAEDAELSPIVREVRDWQTSHSDGSDEEEVPGATRGDILIFTDSPPPPDGASAFAGDPRASDEQAALELVLGFVDDALPKLQEALVRPALGGESQDADRSLRDAALHIAEVLASTGLHDLRTELVAAAHCLSGGTDSDTYELATHAIAHTLMRLEERYRSNGGAPRAHSVVRRLRDSWGDDEPPSAQDTVIEASVPPPPMRPVQAAEALAETPKNVSSAAPSKAAARAEEARAEVLRIDAQKVQLVMDLAGEVGLACGAVVHHPELEGLDLVDFAASAHRLEMLVRELQTEVSSMRLVPVGGVFQRMQRVVRDTAKRTGKKVELKLCGEDTEIDKVLVDALHDPLVHVLRNAIDHGIELPETRLAAGKAETGTIVLAASHEGGEVCVTIRDDGKGLSSKAILAKAKERGLVSVDAQPSIEEIFRYVFLPGFSTKQAIDELSGRGVGMDVIKTTIESFRGRVELASVEGSGTTISLLLPLTLAFVEAMILRDTDNLYAVPMERVREVFVVEASQITMNAAAGGRQVICLRDELIPVLWLREFYDGGPGSAPVLAGRVVVVVWNSRGAMALPVDALHGTQPVMVKPMKGVLSKVRAAAGCGMLRNGDVALALDCERLIPERH
jgi:two-component system chemotaxis sensor kinase CheA